jgi:hypothetical protein
VADLDTPDELALRSLLLGITHRSAQAYGPARQFLLDAIAQQDKVSVNTWIGSIALFELAVLILRTHEAMGNGASWDPILKEAEATIDRAASLSGSTIDLSSRLDSRIAMLRDEIGTKREMLGITSARG